MYYPEEIVEEIRQKNDIVDVISGYVNLKKQGGNYFGLCPFHNEKSPSFSVSPYKQMYYCFGCHKGGNVFTFICDYENYTYPEAIRFLADRAGVSLPEVEYTEEMRKKADKKTKLLEINKEAAKYFYSMLRSPRGQRAMDYFIKRELSPETMQKFGLGYADQYSNDLYKYLKSKGYSDQILKDSGLVTLDERGGHDKFWNRAMFPIMDMNGRVIAFGGRVMGDGEPKYLNSPETMIFDKSRNLFGLYLAKKTHREQLILCEGYMDVIALHQAGFDNACASLGTALTSGHANLLKRYGKEIYLSYDSDGAGVKAALRAIPILKEVGLTCKVINMRPYKDPDEFIKALGAEEYQKRIDEAENSFMFRIRMLQDQYDMSDPESKTAYQVAIADMILEFPEEIERNNYAEAVAKQYNFSLQNLQKLIISRAGKGGIVRKEERKPLKSGIQPKPKQDGMQKSERLLLTWICENPKVYELISPYVDAKDFSEGVYRQVAEEVYKQIAESGAVNPARIVSMFQEEEQQRLVAAIFNTTVGELSSDSDKEKALRETVLRVKKNSMEQDRKNLDPSDIDALTRIVENKKLLEKMKRIKFNV
jgi:DNA primase